MEYNAVIAVCDTERTIEGNVVGRNGREGQYMKGKASCVHYFGKDTN